MKDIPAFISNYQSLDEVSIRFGWNDTDDSNWKFRTTVLEAVLADIDAAPVILIRDLFRAETRSAAHDWGFRDGVDVLGEQLLRRGGIAYLDDFLEGKFACFDTQAGVLTPRDEPLSTTMLNEIRARLAAYPNSPKADLWREGERLFV